MADSRIETKPKCLSTGLYFQYRVNQRKMVQNINDVIMTSSKWVIQEVNQSLITSPKDFLSNAWSIKSLSFMVPEISAIKDL